MFTSKQSARKVDSTESEINFPYTARQIKRARRIRVTIRRDGSVLLTYPPSVTAEQARHLLVQQSDWIRERRERWLSQTPTDITTRCPRHYLQHKETARRLVNDKVKEWNRYYEFTYRRIYIRNQTSRWGSCSARGNLSFSYKIYFLPERLQNYLVIHELCHLAELNHSPRFWSLVARTLPQYRELDRELKHYREP